MGHEKICGSTSVVADQQTRRLIVLCTLEKLCGRTNRAPHSAHPLDMRSTACKRKIYQSEKRKFIRQTTEDNKNLNKRPKPLQQTSNKRRFMTKRRTFWPG